MRLSSSKPTSGPFTTTILVNNIHCASCLSYMEEVFSTLHPAPVSTTANYVSHEVMVVHPQELLAKDISRVLHEAAFEVQSINTRDESDRSVYEQNLAQYSSPAQQSSISSHQTKFDWKPHAKHMKHCVACQQSYEKSSALNLTAKPPEPPKFTAVLSISGMTCAACVVSVTESVQELDSSEDVSVNLLTNTATVTFAGTSNNVDKIVEKIEDRGYGCQIDSVNEIGLLEDEAERTIRIKINGMFCDDCPRRVTDTLSLSIPGLIVDKPSTYKDPITIVTYHPLRNGVTIRNILEMINGIGDQFHATIFHPPTIEERSRAMQLYERRRLLWRLLLSFAIAIPTFLISIVWADLVPSTNHIRKFFQEPMWTGDDTRAEWALFFLSTPVMFLAADVFHVRAMKEIKSLWGRNSKVPILRRFSRFGSMNLLISAGTSVAYFPSIAVLIMDSQRSGQSNGNLSTYFDSVVFLTMFILMGRYLEAYSKARTGDAVAMLGKLRPTVALLEESSEIKKIDIDLLEIGDVVRVPHGSSPPADGIVVLGSSEFNESSLTGESRSIKKNVDDDVFTGTINVGQPVSVRVTKTSGASMLDQIVKVVREGQAKRAPIERVADVLVGYFVPFITLIAILTFVIWTGLGQGGALPDDWQDVHTGGWAFWALQFAIAVFVGACPCGIALAAPTALFVGSGLAAQHGILVKGGGEAFQEASTLDVVVFDKTGTLTVGKPTVTDYEIISSDKEAIWAITRTLEESSSHPIAQAISALCTEQDRTVISDSTIEELPGRGLKGTFSTGSSTYEAAIGSESFISSICSIDARQSSHITVWKNARKSVALLAVRPLFGNKKLPFELAAQFATADEIRPEAFATLEALRNRGLSVWMLSGDNSATANAVGKELGFPEANIISGVLPSEKAEKIRWLQSATCEGRPNKPRSVIAMVGDGINDSPALTAADVGIAIGSGSDVAISSAKFVLVASQLGSLLTLVSLSQTVFRRVKFNFAWALVYNMLLLPIAAGVIYPAHGHPRLSPVWASLAMAMSSVSVICSSLVMRTRLPLVGYRGA